MADNSFKINKSVNFNPQNGLPANPVNGDFFYDSVAGSFVYYHDGNWANFDSIGSVAAVTDMTSAQLTPALVRNSVIKVTGTGGTTKIHGFTASFAAKRIAVYNNTDHTIIVAYQSTTEPTSNNRILTPSGGDMNLVSGEIAQFTYDIVQDRWLLVTISSGAGAQAVATVVSNGIVTLHQASATPTTPKVLTDGDLNTTLGVVGLDGNRAASITPVSSADALTLTGTGSGRGLVSTGTSSGEAGYFTNASFRAITAIGGGTSPAIFATGGSTSGNGITTTGGGTGMGILATGGSGGGAGGKFVGVGNFVGLAAFGAGAPDIATTDIHLTYGVAAIYAQAGSANGNGIVAKGVGVGFAGIRVVGDANGHGIIADGGIGTGFAGIFNGKVNVSSTLDVSGLTTVASLAVNSGGGVSTPGINTDSVNNYNGVFPTTTNNGVYKFGTPTSGEGIGSKRTAGGNQFGLDFYTNFTSRVSISSGGLLTCNNGITVNGSGIIDTAGTWTYNSSRTRIIVVGAMHAQGTRWGGSISNMYFAGNLSTVGASVAGDPPAWSAPTSDGANFAVLFPLNGIGLPQGTTITGIEVLLAGDTSNPTTINCKVRKCDFAGGSSGSTSYFNSGGSSGTNVFTPASVRGWTSIPMSSMAYGSNSTGSNGSQYDVLFAFTANPSTTQPVNVYSIRITYTLTNAIEQAT